MFVLNSELELVARDVQFYFTTKSVDYIKKNYTVETRMVGSELNIFSNNLWRIYQYQLAD